MSDSVELRSGEQVVQCGGGAVCPVCRGPILRGPAVQLSRYTSQLRHTACMPKSDTRGGAGGRPRRGHRRIY